MSLTRNILVFCLIGSVAFAHGGATGLVKERMDGMLVLSDALKKLSLELKSETPNVEAISSLALNLQNHSGQEMTDKFPEGSLDNPSEASPEIWNDFDGFSDSANELFALAEALENDPSSLSELFPKISRTCKACHQNFRVKK